MITIIGAGPIGCYTAGLLSRKGLDVQIFEEHEKIGKPVQCTGIVTKEIEKIIRINEDFMINKLDSVKIYSKNNFAEIKVREIVFDREKFDGYLADKAIDSGAKIFAGHQFLDFDQKNKIIKIKDTKNNKIKKIKTDILIAADGPLSPAAKSVNLFRDKKFYLGMQARVKLRSDNSFTTYFGSICPDFFAWIVPENENIARIGLATKANTKFYFENFLKKINVDDKIIEKQSGLIPIFNPKQKLNYKNIYLVGDAAGQVKATTGGGIVPGLVSAKILSDCILKNKNYEREFRKKIGKELLINLRLRNILNKFNDKDYDYLLKLINQGRIKKILEEHNRDYPSKFLFKLILNEPRFLLFAKKIIV